MRMGHDIMWRLAFEPSPGHSSLPIAGLHLIETNEACSRLDYHDDARYTKGALLTLRLSIDLSVVKHDVKHIKVIASELVNKLVTL